MKRSAPEEPEDDGGPLFARARSTDPATSHAAAASIESERLSALRGLVLATIRSNGPIHDERLISLFRASSLEFSDSGIRTRRSELVKMGKVRDSGVRVKLPSGRSSIVWEVA